MTLFLKHFNNKSFVQNISAYFFKNKILRNQYKVNNQGKYEFTLLIS